MNSFYTENFLGNTTNGVESDTYKVSVVNYTQKVSEDWHFHEKTHISSIIQGGNLESRKGQDIQVEPGKIMVYDQGEVHRNRFTAHPSKNLNIELEESFFTGDISFSNLNLDVFSNTEILKIYFELIQQDQYSSESIEQTLKSLFWNDKARHKSDWVSKVKTILNDRWNEFVALDELAKEVQVHPITISKYFSKTLGISLSDYMRRIKVGQAIQMFMNSSESFAAVAFYCGFTDQSHMNKLVKLHTGYTPRAIRLMGN